MRCTVWGGGGPYACSCHSAVPQGLVAGPERLRLSQPCTAICTAICKPVRTTMFRSSRTANAHSWLADHSLMVRLAWQRQKPGPRRPTVATRFADEASPANVRPFHVINSSAIAPEHCHVTSRWRAQLCLPPRCYSRSRPSPRRGGDFWTKNVVFRVPSDLVGASSHLGQCTTAVAGATHVCAAEHIPHGEIHGCTPTPQCMHPDTHGHTHK